MRTDRQQSRRPAGRDDGQFQQPRRGVVGRELLQRLEALRAVVLPVVAGLRIHPCQGGGLRCKGVGAREVDLAAILCTCQHAEQQLRIGVIASLRELHGQLPQPAPAGVVVGGERGKIRAGMRLQPWRYLRCNGHDPAGAGQQHQPEQGTHARQARGVHGVATAAAATGSCACPQ